MICGWAFGGWCLDVARRRQAIWRDEVLPRSFPRCSGHQADGSPTHPFVNPRPGRPGEPGLLLVSNMPQYMRDYFEGQGVQKLVDLHPLKAG